jgi:hypothetical protein
MPRQYRPERAENNTAHHGRNAGASDTAAHDAPPRHGPTHGNPPRVHSNALRVHGNAPRVHSNALRVHSNALRVYSNALPVYSNARLVPTSALPGGTTMTRAGGLPAYAATSLTPVIARRAAPWQSTRPLDLPRRPGNLQGHVDCHVPAALAMTVQARERGGNQTARSAADVNAPPVYMNAARGELRALREWRAAGAGAGGRLRSVPVSC